MKDSFNFKNASIKGFLFFLLLTTVVALFNKLSKEYNATFSLPISIEGIPLNYSLSKQSAAEIEVSTELNGFSLLFNTIKTPQINISKDQLIDNGDGKWVYKVDEDRDYLQSKFMSNISIQSVNPKMVSFVLDTMYTKKVRVIPSIDFLFEPGFNASDSLKVSPPVIELIGERSLLDSIQSIFTAYKAYTSVNTDIQDRVYIDTSNLGRSIRLRPNQVSLYQKVSKFTEGNLIVPITIKNNTGTPITIFPKTTEITYNIALENLEHLDVSEFKVTCELNENNSNEYLVLKLTNIPEEVSQARMVTKQVQFIKLKE